MRKLEIEIPNNKEIDWEASAKQKQIVFKDKSLTYEDVCDKLFDKGHYYTDDNGDIRFINRPNECPNNATSEHQLSCILAKNKLANVARYLNGDWKWKLGGNEAFFIIIDKSSRDDEICLDITAYWRYPDRANTLFKSREAAQQAIEILGEKTVKLALEPLY